MQEIIPRIKHWLTETVDHQNIIHGYIKHFNVHGLVDCGYFRAHFWCSSYLTVEGLYTNMTYPQIFCLSRMGMVELLQDFDSARYK